MQAKYIQRGTSIDYTPAADVSAGDIVIQGDLIGISSLDIPANKLGAISLSGVYDIAKATGEATAIAAGTKVYWDAENSVVTSDDNSGANKYVGKAVKASGDDDAVVRVRLSQ